MSNRTDFLIRCGGIAIGTLLIVVSAFFSDLALKRSLYKFETELFQPLELADPDLIKVASLNYRTFAADLAWVASVVDYGESTRSDRVSVHFIDNGFALTEIDPRFRRPYDWFPNVAITRTAVPTEEELDRLNHLIERGMENFPNDGSLPFSAAMNYVGYGAFVSDERKLRETDNAIQFLEAAVQREGTPPSAPFVLQWFKTRRARLSGVEDKDPADEARLIARLLLSVEDEQARKRLQRRLEGMEASSEAAEQSIRYEERLQSAQDESNMTFLPTNLWIVTELP